MRKRDQFIRQAREWLNTPFRPGACAKGRGADCGLFLVKIGLDMGLVDKALLNRKNALKRDLKPLADQYLKMINRKDMQPGDIVLMYDKPGGRLKHLGLITQLNGGRLGLLHAHSSVGKVVEHGLDIVWQKKIQFVYTWGG